MASRCAWRILIAPGTTSGRIAGQRQDDGEHDEDRELGEVDLGCRHPRQEDERQRHEERGERRPEERDEAVVVAGPRHDDEDLAGGSLPPPP